MGNTWSRDSHSPPLRKSLILSLSKDEAVRTKSALKTPYEIQLSPQFPDLQIIASADARAGFNTPQIAAAPRADKGARRGQRMSLYPRT